MVHSRTKKVLLRLLVAMSSFVLFTCVAELAYRVHIDGFPEGLVGLVEKIKVPYSNLGTSNWVIYDEELGYRLNPKNHDIHDSLSIRHGEVSIPGDGSAQRILVLGDSVPWDSPGFVDHLAAALQGLGSYEILNASVPGYTSYQEVIFYERYLMPTSPDLVLWTYCLNDNHRFLHHFDEQANMLITEEARETYAIDSLWDRVASRSYILSRMRADRLRRQAKERQRACEFPWEGRVDFSVAWKDHSWAGYEENLKRLKKLLARTNVKLAMVICPFEPQLKYDKASADLQYVLKPQRKLRELCERYEVPCLDLYPALRESYSRGKKLFRDGVHLTEAGHRITAVQILAFLKREQLIPLD